jgi:FAD/FMN-containing dehydrogenase
LKNPYYIGDEAGLTQTLGWADAWTSKPSAYAVAAESTQDVVAAVNFARENNVQIVIKGGGHSYQGTSSSADSLLIWTRKMTDIRIHDSFVGAACEGKHQPVHAVTIGAGVLWGQAYDTVAREAGRYVQGGGCLTVGVAGLVHSGGFGPFSKAYGLAAASLVEAEIVTADGKARIVNACTNTDLFWAIKGGGGGSFGVLTRVTLRTHALPNFFGGVFTTIKASSPEAFRWLIAKVVSFYATALFNPHWGEQIAFRPGNELGIGMVFQGLDQPQATEVWDPFFDWITSSPEAFEITSGPNIVAIQARDFWNPKILRQIDGLVMADDRASAPEGNVFWAGNLEEAGQVLHAYESTWIPESFLDEDQQEALSDAVFQATRHWGIALHFNKGLAGAPPQAIESARDTAINPAALRAFALAISGAEGPPAYPGVPGYEPDVERARREAASVQRATSELRRLLPSVNSYVAESSFFEPRWQEAFWGSNYPRLRQVKEKYDPDGLFVVHHGVGSEAWTPDGFVRNPIP